MSPLMLAARCGHTDSLRALLSSGADMFLREGEVSRHIHMHIHRYVGVYHNTCVSSCNLRLPVSCLYSCMCIKCILLLSVIVSSWNTNSIQTCLASIIIIYKSAMFGLMVAEWLDCSLPGCCQWPHCHTRGAGGSWGGQGYPNQGEGHHDMLMQ